MPVFTIPLGNFSLEITQSIIVQWAIIAILAILSFLLTKDLKKKPDKKQAALEKIYVTIESLMTSNMGESYRNFLPYIGSLMIYLLCLNLTGLIGVQPPTKDISVAFGLALSSFLAIHYNAIKRNGFGHYLKGYAQPFIFMAPINLMERVMLPVSLCLRLFGNMMAATVLVDLVYEAAGKFAIGFPIILHGYFDLFDGTIQMVVFSMLTMIQIKLTADH